jgi:hypothetical protein
MKITLEQVGGLAGIRRRFTLDTADLGDARAEVETLAVEALARALKNQSTAPGSPHPDEMGYTLNIAADDGTRELAGTDTSASTEFARLVKQVKSRGKAEAV